MGNKLTIKKWKVIYLNRATSTMRTIRDSDSNIFGKRKASLYKDEPTYSHLRLVEAQTKKELAKQRCASMWELQNKETPGRVLMAFICFNEAKQMIRKEALRRLGMTEGVLSSISIDNDLNPTHPSVVLKFRQAMIGNCTRLSSRFGGVAKLWTSKGYSKAYFIHCIQRFKLKHYELSLKEVPLFIPAAMSRFVSLKLAIGNAQRKQELEY
eukprot:IDg4314t1